jgi:flagellar hook-associated protein FlgK
MGSLFASLISTASSLRAYDRSLSVIQNNVANADSPGFSVRPNGADHQWGEDPPM